jgi:membrane protease YdiL (CAAX protease family)
LFIAVIILLNRIPVGGFFADFNFSIRVSASLENILVNAIVIGLCFWLIIKFRFVSFLRLRKFEIKHLIYFLPLMFYIIFLGNETSVFEIDNDVFYSKEMLIVVVEKFTSAVLEEIVFRGLVLALIINTYIERKNGMLISVLLASFIFGTTHFSNILTQSDLLTVHGVIKQVYIATCLGVMFSAMFLKSRNIFILIIGHFVLNLFSILEELKMKAAPAAAGVMADKTSFEIIGALILILLIFGIPLLIGIFILRSIPVRQLKCQLQF